MTLHRSAAAFAALLTATAELSAGVTIADLAPRESFIVVGVDSWGAVEAAYERTPLHALWADERVRTFLVATFEESYGDPVEFLNALDPAPDVKDLAPPEGAIGAALFFDDDGDGGVVMRMLLVCDYAENNDDADEAWLWLEDVIDRLEAHGSVDRDFSDHGDVEIVTVTRIEADGAVHGDNEMDAEIDEEDLWWMDDHEDARTVFDDPMHIARSGNVMLVSTSMERLHDALDRARGVELGETLRDNKDYTDTLAQHAPGALAHGAIMLRSTREALEHFADGPIGDVLASALPTAWYVLDMVGPMIEPLGLDAVHAASLTVYLDTPNAVAEFGYAGLVPDKRGVFSLFEGAPRQFTPPAFVGADAAGVNAYRINFQDIPRLVRTVIANMPDEEERGLMMEQAEFALTQAEPVLAVMQPELITVTRIERPFTAQSRSMIFAVPISQTQPITDALTMLGQFAGLAPRDFQGNQIWEAEFIPMAVGVGAGHVFLGPTTAIETALREAAAPDAPKLAAEPRFVRAASAVARDGIVFSYQEMAPAIEHTAWIAANMDSVFEEQLRAMGLNPGDEYYDEIYESMRTSQSESMKLFPPPDLFTRALGDVVSEFKSTTAGYVGRWLLLRPSR